MKRWYKFSVLCLLVISILPFLTACSDDDPVKVLILDTIAGPIILGLVIDIIIGCIFGAVTNTIIHNKGYWYKNWFWAGFFGWGIAVIVAAVQTEAPHEPTLHEQQMRSMEQKSYVKGSTPVPAGFWRCVCGVANPPNVGTCSCGLKRSEAVRLQQEKTRESIEKSKKAIEAAERIKAKGQSRGEVSTPKTPASDVSDEKERVRLLKEYKELLDSGVISEEEFNAKKASLLNEK